MNWQQHKKRWKDCTRCALHEHRCKVAIGRGKIPCDILFIGEAPGTGEDVFGKPFVGDAGILLDEMIVEAFQEISYDIDEARLFFTNLVGCIPYDENLVKTKEPPKEAIKACLPRLQEIVRMTNPKHIVNVGKLAEKHNRKNFDTIDQTSITHPAALLRAPVDQKGLLIQRNTVILTDLFESIYIPF